MKENITANKSNQKNIDINKLFSFIDEMSEHYLNVLVEICKIQSPTQSKSGVDEVGKFITDIANALGWEVEVFAHKISGNVISITMNNMASLPPLSLSAHMDTVYPVELFSDFKVTKDDKYIYGPGVADCKGGIVVCLLAMEALSRVGFKDRPIQLLLQVDEEMNCMPSRFTSIKTICDLAKNSVAFLNCEPAIRNTVTLARKGIARYKFSITGQAEHAALCYNGSSAIAEAAQKILILEKYKDPVGITCNCGTINGGTVSNTVPDKCEFMVDIRFFTEEQYALIQNIISRLEQQVFVQGCKTTVELLNIRPEMPHADKNYKLLDNINNILVSNGFEALSARTSGGGSDAAYITKAGIPCVDSVGIVGGNLHSLQEYAEINSIPESAKKIALIALFI